MLEKLSVEIQLIILKYCTFRSIIQLRQVQVCWLYKTLVEEELLKTVSLDVAVDYMQIYDSFGDTAFITDIGMCPRKLINFLAKYMPQIRKLSLRSTPFTFQLSDLIQIAEAAPFVEWLDISQVDNKPSFGKYSTMALPYFRNLKTLKMDGFSVKRSNGKSCLYELEIPPMKFLRSLENIEILEGVEKDCPKNTVLGILLSLHKDSTVLSCLKHVNFGVRQCHRQLPELLIWFLNWHKRLRSIRLHNVLFETDKQLSLFYRALMLLPALNTVELDHCTQIATDSRQMHLQFIKSLNSKGILLSG